MTDVNPSNGIISADRSGIAEAAKRLLSGNLVAFPTETVYGLGADATNPAAVAKIFDAKQRPQFNPLIVHVAELSMIETDVIINDLAKMLIDAFWPGPLTLVLPRSNDCSVSELVSAGLDSLAVRMPNHDLANHLLTITGRPIAAPSANRSESISPTSPNHVLQSLGQDACMILDGGPTRIGLESTVVDTRGATPIILRPGGVTADDLSRVCGFPLSHSSDHEQPRSPGQLRRHYAPAIPLIYDADKAPPGWAYLGFGSDSEIRPTLNLSLTGDLTEAASNLFAMLRDLEQRRFDGIAVAPIPNIGLGLAINDRLHRAGTAQKAV